jgi:transcriptional regulator with AAA-type ATPase domain
MITFDQTLDVVMELPDEQQEMLLDIIQHRRFEAR